MDLASIIKQVQETVMNDPNYRVFPKSANLVEYGIDMQLANGDWQLVVRQQDFKTVRNALTKLHTDMPGTVFRVVGICEVK